MKFLILSSLLLVSAFTFADTIKKGTSYSAIFSDSPDVIQVTIKENSAKLVYEKMKEKEVMAMRTGAFDLFEKRAENILCTKSSVDEDLPIYECTVKLNTAGNMLKFKQY